MSKIVNDKNEDKSFLYKLLNLIENFNFTAYKENKQQKKEKKEKEKEVEKEKEASGTTIADVGNQRRKHIYTILKRLLLIGFVVILLSGFVILMMQNNEQEPRRIIDPHKIFNDKSSFGSIDKKDYYLEQNVLNEKLDNVTKTTNIKLEKVLEAVTNQNKNANDAHALKLEEFKKEQAKEFDEKFSKVLQVTENINKKIESLAEDQQKLDKKVDNVKVSSITQLKNAKIEFPDLNKNTNTHTEHVNNAYIKPANNIQLNKDSIYGKNTYEPTNKELYVEEEIEITINDNAQTEYSTSTLEVVEEKKFKPFKLDLTKSMARVTLLEGVKAPVSSKGLKNPVPVLLIIEDILYTANDTVADLKGCFLSGSAVGNINTERVEIFGTNMSCIIVANNGKKYKIEHQFKKNKVWIKGEDGGTGIQGQIVDSSGKVLAKSVAIGFLQGVSNIAQSMNNANPVIAGTGAVSFATNPVNLQNNLAAGVSEGLKSGFELSIEKYEEILEGYYPYIDTKGGRTMLTAVFDGNEQLEVKEYKEPNLQRLRENNLEEGFSYEETTEEVRGGKK